MARTHLDEMREAIMIGDRTPSMEMRVPHRPEFTPRKMSAATMIVQLKTVLFAERRARITAEARLRSVLEEVAKMKAIPPPTPAAEEIVEVEAAEIIEPKSDALAIQEAIYEVGGDDDESEEDGYGS